jgi:dihydrofolate synthase/folylpolyglutamate synthase
MRYEDAMKYIYEVGNFGSNYGLERTYRILELLDNPHKELKLIHIAGTNGKGSITAMVTELLIGKGYKVGMYTSPFLEEFEERIQINGVNIPKLILGELMDELKEAVDKVVLEGYNHPTEFEIITCLMLLYFKNEGVDYGVIEVGLGGRLDSTNVIIPILTIIASISLDHTNLLGNTIGEIAAEKAGIIKQNVPVVIYPQIEEASNVIKERADKLNAPLYTLEGSFGDLLEVVSAQKYYQRILINLDGEKFTVNLPLLGEHQINNLLVALKAFKVICITENISFDIDEIKTFLLNVKWKGRLEVMNMKPLIVIDGAHNIQGITALNQNIKKYFKYNNLYLLLGILADKEVEKMVKIITPKAKKVFALTPHNDRAKLAEELKKVVIKYNSNCIAVEDYKEALNIAINEAKEDDLILISGSLYMIGDIRKNLKDMNKIIN